MATIIKSNNVSTNNLGSIVQNILPQNGLTGFFDFSNDNYLANGTKINLTDLVSVTRSSTAQGIAKDGSRVNYAVNTPRLHFVESVKKYGLALGDVKKNHFLNSNSPTTQIITIDEGVERKWFLVVECVGSGSVSISGAFTGTATEGNPLIFKVSTTSPITITATIIGNLTHVGVCKQSSPYGIEPTRVTTSGVPAAKVQDVTQLKTVLFKSLYSSDMKSTIFMKMTKFDGGEDSLTPFGVAKHIEISRAFGNATDGGYLSWLEMIDGNNAKMWVKKQKNGAVLEESPKVDVSWNKTNITAFRSNKTKSSIFLNGVFSEMAGSTSELVDPTLLFLPSLLTPSNSDLIAPNSVITHLIVYNRELTNSEINSVYDILK